jgi:hypothetical protein
VQKFLAPTMRVHRFSLLSLLALLV